jgi:hypothetical protein
VSEQTVCQYSLGEDSCDHEATVEFSGIGSLRLRTCEDHAYWAWARGWKRPRPELATIPQHRLAALEAVAQAARIVSKYPMARLEAYLSPDQIAGFIMLTEALAKLDVGK